MGKKQVTYRKMPNQATLLKRKIFILFRQFLNKQHKKQAVMR